MSKWFFCRFQRLTKVVVMQMAWLQKKFNKVDSQLVVPAVCSMHFCISRSLEMKNSWENWALPGRRQLMQKISSSLKTFVWQGWWCSQETKNERKWANNWLIIAHMHTYPFYIKQNITFILFRIFPLMKFSYMNSKVSGWHMKPISYSSFWSCAELCVTTINPKSWNRRVLFALFSAL